MRILSKYVLLASIALVYGGSMMASQARRAPLQSPALMNAFVPEAFSSLAAAEEQSEVILPVIRAEEKSGRLEAENAAAMRAEIRKVLAQVEERILTVAAQEQPAEKKVKEGEEAKGEVAQPGEEVGGETEQEWQAEEKTLESTKTTTKPQQSALARLEKARANVEKLGLHGRHGGMGPGRPPMMRMGSHEGRGHHHFGHHMMQPQQLTPEQQKALKDLQEAREAAEKAGVMPEHHHHFGHHGGGCHGSRCGRGGGRRH